jgi:hypothetical protein
MEKRAQAEFCGQRFWASGYFVSTVGRDETAKHQRIVQEGDLDAIQFFSLNQGKIFD